MSELAGDVYRDVFEGVILTDGETGGLVVFYQGINNTVGVAGGFAAPEDAADIRGPGTLTLSLSGQDFEIPTQFSEPSDPSQQLVGLAFSPRNAASPQPWKNQIDFLTRLPIARHIFVKRVTNSKTGQSVEADAVFRSNSCSADGFKRVFRAAGISSAATTELCIQLFCGGDEEFLIRFESLIDSAPSDTFARPKAEVIKNARLSAVIGGRGGVISYAEGVCFGVNGIANR